MKLVAALLAVSLLGACGGPITQIHFWPQPAVPREQRATGTARFVAAADLPRLVAVGGRLLGVVRVETETVADLELRQNVGEAAARVGGTHIREADTTESAAVRRVEHTAPATPRGSRLHVTDFEVYAVPRARWPDLPTELRP